MSVDSFKISDHRVLNPSDRVELEAIRGLIQDDSVTVVDRIEHQVKELLKIESVGKSEQPTEWQHLIAARLGTDPLMYGSWVYYPWNKTLIHLLSEEDFIRVRTDRNRDKITSEEQKKISAKSVGVIGMSVGRAVATTIALERIVGELRIADFDTLDLSNLNRLKAPLRDLGLPKTVSVSREIAEIDPFLSVRAFEDGFTAQNGEEFIRSGERYIDVLVDECDSLEVKIACRELAKKHRIPVVMETSDRGMLDVERFDLDPDRPIFHGKLDGLDLSQRPFSPELRMQVLMKIIDFEQLSERAKLSLPQVGKTLSTWPQLASSVVLGGGTVANTVRKLLLGEEVSSGRYYVDMDKIITT